MELTFDTLREMIRAELRHQYAETKRVTGLAWDEKSTGITNEENIESHAVMCERILLRKLLRLAVSDTEAFP
jgi:hypothetical protein